jgi:hypothetical protein
LSRPQKRQSSFIPYEIKITKFYSLYLRVFRPKVNVPHKRPGNPQLDTLFGTKLHILGFVDMLQIETGLLGDSICMHEALFPSRAPNLVTMPLTITHQSLISWLRNDQVH